MPAEWFAAGRKICEANAPLQTVRVERLVRHLRHLWESLDGAKHIEAISIGSGDGRDLHFYVLEVNPVFTAYC